MDRGKEAVSIHPPPSNIRVSFDINSAEALVALGMASMQPVLVEHFQDYESISFLCVKVSFLRLVSV